jgi:signal transduction histidine kinase
MSTGQLDEHEVPYQQLKRLVELSMKLNSTLDLNDLLELIVTTAAELLNCEAASILLYDERNPRLYFAAATGSNPARLAETPVPIDGSLAGTIFRTNQPLILNDVENDPRHYFLVSDHIKFKVKSLLGVPMSMRERTVGVLEAVNKRSGQFDARDAALLAVTATHAAIAIDNARLLQATKKALQQVKESDQLKSNFLSLASHELRTPLGIIIGYSTFLKENVGGANSDRAGQVLNAARKMRSLLDEMNNLAMLKSDEMLLKPQRVSLQEILTSAGEGMREFAAVHEQRLTFVLPEEPIPVNVDIKKTTLAFTNLLNNAIRFSPPEGEIMVGAVRDGEDAMSWVQDRGRGIPKDQLQKIFEAFYQIETTETGQRGGLGIGLSIAKGIIEAQEGEIWAESEGGGAGATFKVLLPLAPSSP